MGHLNLGKHFPYHTSIFIQTDLCITYHTSGIELWSRRMDHYKITSPWKQIKSNMFSVFSWTNQLYNVKMGIEQLKIIYNNACVNQ